jgi:hypothetical protein
MRIWKRCDMLHDGSPLTHSNILLLAVRVLDAAIFFWLPQINVIILRLVQRRNLLHRMVGRTVVIGDIPWVAQAAEEFLSKVSVCHCACVVLYRDVCFRRFPRACFGCCRCFRRCGALSQCLIASFVTMPKHCIADLCLFLQHCRTECPKWESSGSLCAPSYTSCCPWFACNLWTSRWSTFRAVHCGGCSLSFGESGE